MSLKERTIQAVVAADQKKAEDAKKTAAEYRARGVNAGRSLLTALFAENDGTGVSIFTVDSYNDETSVNLDKKSALNLIAMLAEVLE